MADEQTPLASANTIRSHIIMRNDTLANWSESTAIPKKGEILLALCDDGSYIIKVGNGVNVWKDLPLAKADVMSEQNFTKKETLVEQMNELEIVMDSGNAFSAPSAG